MRIALLCSGLGHVVRGHEVFAQDLFNLLADELDITLFVGAGAGSSSVISVPCVQRTSPLLDHMKLSVAPRWESSVREEERNRIEHETFAYGAMAALLEGNYDVIHCLEQEVANIVFDNRTLFRRTPKVLFSNGGAISARHLPQCDFVQEHTECNLASSAGAKSFMIPHGVDLKRFQPGKASDFRQRHGIPAEAFVVISVGTVGINHKRMDYVIREVAPLPHVHLLIVGQDSGETPGIKALGSELLGDRVVFAKLPHEQLPEAYAAADVFALGSRFETFGIVYIEAMAMGLPVFCSDNPNQRSIVKEAVFVDVDRPGALTAALRDTPRERLEELARRGRAIVEKHYDLQVLKRQYVAQYRRIAAAPSTLRPYGWRTATLMRLRKGLRQMDRLFKEVLG